MRGEINGFFIMNQIKEAFSVLFSVVKYLGHG